MFGMLLTLSIIGITVQGVTRKIYNRKVTGGAFTFSAMSVLFSLLVFVIISGGEFDLLPKVFPYSLGFALFYSAAMVGTFFAIVTGPLSITGLISKYSLLIPTLYGILFLKEPTGHLLYIGLALLAVSLLLVNFEGKTYDKKLSLKWAIFMIISFIGNGGCSAVQKIQQINFSGAYKNEFMIIALAFSFLSMLAVALIFERDNFRKKVTVGAHWYIICGLANGLVNLFVMMLAKWPASIVFPVISAGGIVATAIVGVFIYREKMSIPQIFGMLLGTASIVFLNL